MGGEGSLGSLRTAQDLEGVSDWGESAGPRN